MRSLRVLLFSDEVALMGDAVRSELKDYKFQIFDQSDVTRAAAERESEQGIAIDIAPVDDLEGVISRHNLLGRDYDAYSLYSLRVWRFGATLLEWVNRIRACDVVAESGLRLRALPIAIMNPLDKLQSLGRTTDDFHKLLAMPHVTATNHGEKFPDCLMRNLAGWYPHVLEQLEYCGYGVEQDELGRWSVSAAFRRPEVETEFFARPPNVAALGRMGVFRVSANVMAIEGGLVALEEALNEAARLSPKKREPRMQRCFEEHPELLTQGLYDSFWAEPELASGDPLRRGVRPDFVVAGTEGWEHVLRPRVYELKSPEFRVSVAKKASEELLKGLEQLGDRYRQYFEDERNRAHQVSVLGREIRRPRLMLVIGRNRWLQDWVDVDEMQARSAREIGIVSYDDIGALNDRRLSVLKRLSFRARPL